MLGFGFINKPGISEKATNEDTDIEFFFCISKSMKMPIKGVEKDKFEFHLRMRNKTITNLLE